MTDIPVSTNCKSERCKGAGLCSCVHVYSDGSAVPGSGQIDDPYVHERAVINCVLDPNGVPLPVDNNRCVILPNSAQSVSLNGSTILPNATGQIVVQETFVENFSFTDSEGGSLTITDGSTVNLAADGDASQGYAAINAEVPTIVGNSIVFPQMKVHSTTRGALLPLPSNNAVALPSIGNSINLFTQTPGILLTKSKTTNYIAHIGLGIMQDDLVSLSVGGIEQYTYSMEILFQSTLGGAVQTFPMGTIKSWTPNFGRGYEHNTHTISFNVTGPTTADTNAYINVRLTCITDLLAGPRNLIAEADLTLSYI